jgi:hypothetical protein
MKLLRFGSRRNENWAAQHRKWWKTKMAYLKSFSDSRLVAYCVFCNGPTESRDHCPSRVLLDEPDPEQLPAVPACGRCNAGFSLDEEYFACLVEAARTGGGEKVSRPKIVRILQQRPALTQRLNRAKQISDTGDTIFSVERQRVRSVVLKLARGHAAFELSEAQFGDPAHVMFMPIHLLTHDERTHFESPPAPAIWPEVGSRAMQRMSVSGDAAFSDWIEVQEGQYR